MEGFVLFVIENGNRELFVGSEVIKFIFDIWFLIGFFLVGKILDKLDKMFWSFFLIVCFLVVGEDSDNSFVVG